MLADWLVALKAECWVVHLAAETAVCLVALWVGLLVAWWVDALADSLVELKAVCWVDMMVDLRDDVSADLLVALKAACWAELSAAHKRPDLEISSTRLPDQGVTSTPHSRYRATVRVAPDINNFILFPSTPPRGREDIASAPLTADR